MKGIQQSGIAGVKRKLAARDCPQTTYSKLWSFLAVLVVRLGTYRPLSDPLK